MDINYIIQGVMAIALGAIGYFLKDLKDSIKKEIYDNKTEINTVKKELTEKINNVDKKVDNFKDHVNKNFVDKENYIRDITNFDRKLDKITDLIIEMKGEQKRE